MPTQPTMRRAQSLRSTRQQRLTRSVNHPTVGQYFDIELSRDGDGWQIRIPEIGAVTRTHRRATVEVAARECISNHTGIPIGYVGILVASEID